MIMWDGDQSTLSHVQRRVSWGSDGQNVLA